MQSPLPRQSLSVKPESSTFPLPFSTAVQRSAAIRILRATQAFKLSFEDIGGLSPASAFPCRELSTQKIAFNAREFGPVAAAQRYRRFPMDGTQLQRIRLDVR